MTATSPPRTLRIAMNGIPGRMGYRQHLVRSILAIRDQGSVLLDDGTRVQVEPILLGRNGSRVRELAELHGSVPAAVPSRRGRGSVRRAQG